MSLYYKAGFAIGRTIGAVLVGVIRAVSLRDYMLIGGLALLAYGLSLVSVPAAYIVPGAVLALVAIFGVR